MKVQPVPVMPQKENSSCDSIPFYQKELGFYICILNSNFEFGVVHFLNKYFLLVQIDRSDSSISPVCLHVVLVPWECTGTRGPRVEMRPLFCFLSCTLQHSPVTTCLHLLIQNTTVMSIKIWWNVLELSQILPFLDCCSLFELLHGLLLVIICQSDFLIFIPALFRSSVLSSVSLCHNVACR